MAPTDVEYENCARALRNFAPISREPLSFPNALVGSDGDRACSPQRAMHLAYAWGAETMILSEAGHINTKSNHGAWEAGYCHLFRLRYPINSQARRRA